MTHRMVSKSTERQIDEVILESCEEGNATRMAIVERCIERTGTSMPRAWVSEEVTRRLRELKRRGVIVFTGQKTHWNVRGISSV